MIVGVFEQDTQLLQQLTGVEWEGQDANEIGNGEIAGDPPLQHTQDETALVGNLHAPPPSHMHTHTHLFLLLVC